MAVKNVTTGAEYINALDGVFTSTGVDKLIDLYSDDYLNFHLVNSSLDELVKSGFVHPMKKNNIGRINCKMIYRFQNMVALIFIISGAFGLCVIAVKLGWKGGKLLSRKETTNTNSELSHFWIWVLVILLVIIFVPITIKIGR